MRGRLRRASLAAIAVTILASCGSSEAAGGSGEADLAAIHVEADMFSGRPNPAWTLDAKESQQVADCLSNATVEDVSALPHEGLGFRAFSLTGLPADLKYAQVDVSRDAVIASASGGNDA